MTFVRNPKKRTVTKVIFPRRNYLTLMRPKDTARSQDPLVDSIGVFADFPLWDEYLAILEENRQAQNLREGSDA